MAEEPDQLADFQPSSISQMESQDLEAVLNRRTPGRTWLVRSGIVALVLVVGVTLLWRASGRRPSTLPLFAQAATVAPARTAFPIQPSNLGGFNPSATQALLSSDVATATYTLNGGKQQSFSGQVLIAPTAGQNTIVFTAPPFPSKTCAFTWTGTFNPDPSATGCHDDAGTQYNGGDYIIIDVSLSSDDLPPDQQAQVTGKLQRILDAANKASPKATVPRGDYIATGYDDNGNPTYKKATTPLIATLVSTIFPQPQFTNGCTAALCPGPVASGPGSFPALPQGGQLVQLIPDFTVQWQFTDPVTHRSTDITTGNAYYGPTNVLLWLIYTPGSGWQISPQYNSISAQSFTQTVNIIASTMLMSTGNIDLSRLIATAYISANGYGYNIISTGTVTIAGCKITIITNGVTGTFIERFGAILAVDSGAHTLAPSVPTAPKDEITAVQDASS